MPGSIPNLGLDIKSFNRTVHMIKFLISSFPFCAFRVRLSDLLSSELVWIYDSYRRYDFLNGWTTLLQGRYISRTTQIWKKHEQTSIPRVEFEPNIQVFERVKVFPFLSQSWGRKIVMNCLSYDFLYETEKGLKRFMNAWFGHWVLTVKGNS
jgi:hypothetical protein